MIKRDLFVSPDKINQIVLVLTSVSFSFSVFSVLEWSYGRTRIRVIGINFRAFNFDQGEGNLVRV